MRVLILVVITITVLLGCGRDPALDAIYALPEGVERYYGNHFEMRSEKNE